MLFTSGPKFQLAKIAGIPIKIHWSFSLLIILISSVSYLYSASWLPASALSLFVFVILHELGHALAARKYHAHTSDIIISPIGGLARLVSLPKEPMSQLWIASAGPLVNLTIMLTLYLIQILFYSKIDFPFDLGDLIHQNDLLGILILINAALVLFNLVPAYPMDGGRILKSLLRIGGVTEDKATMVAVGVGFAISILLIIIALIKDQYMLIMIAVFIMITGYQELKRVGLI